MKQNLKKVGLTVATFALPLVSLAADGTIGGIISDLGVWVGKLVPIATAVALLVFIWGLVTFIAKSGSEEARVEGRQRMLWGIIALFCIVSVWGLTAFVGRTILGTQSTGGSVNAPQIPHSSN